MDAIEEGRGFFISCTGRSAIAAEVMEVGTVGVVTTLGEGEAAATRPRGTVKVELTGPPRRPSAKWLRNDDEDDSGTTVVAAAGGRWSAREM